jgi:hypothetical protein
VAFSKKEQRVADLSELIAGAMRGIFEGFDKIIPSPKSGKYPDYDLVTFQDVVKYFKKERPNDFRITGGALIMRKAPGGIALFQMFLDDGKSPVSDKNGVLLGRAILAREIDDELRSGFGHEELILFH